MGEHPQKIEIAKPRRILVRTPNWIGDHVMARDFYRGLRQVYPHAHITFLSTDPVFGMEDGAFCDQKILLPKEAKRGRPLWQMARKLRKEKFDLAVTLPATLSSALLLFLAGIPERTGFIKDGNSIFLNSAIHWRGRAAQTHKAVQYFQLLEFLSGHPVFLKIERPPIEAPEKIIAIAPGASIALREWPYFEVLLQRLEEEFPSYRFLVVGGARENAWRERLKALSLERTEDWIGKTTLPELVSLLKRAKVVVANDSGVAHIAATLSDRPTVVLFGPGDPHYIAPTGDRVTSVRIALPCSPCEKPYCAAPYGYQKCLKDLRPQTVLAEIARWIRLSG